MGYAGDTAKNAISSFVKLKLPDDKPKEIKGKGMMSRARPPSQSNDAQASEQPVIRAKRIQMYLNEKRLAMKETKKGSDNEAV
mgnify:FL=1|jgi:hypothetical protein|tara:strand:+ start:1778 stop:2026 length:249 start_codon:yes stop_codon:yes gene_type:complete